MKRVVTIGAVLIGILLSSCGGDDGDATTSPAAPVDAVTTSPAPPLDAPSGGAAPPSDLGALPPGFVQCMADQGFDIQSSAEIHSAPPQLLQACFGGIGH